MRVVVFGASGMLGHKLVQVFSDAFEVYGTVRGSILDYSDLPFFKKARLVGGVDATRFETVSEIVEGLRPHVVVNAVGLVKQHTLGTDAEECRLINEMVPKHLASASESIGARFVGISTDCVYAGTKGLYTESDAPDAEDAYGVSKARGEVVSGQALIIRTSIIGRELSGNRGLVEWFLSNRGGKVKGYSNAVFSGFPTVVLAEILKKVIIEDSGLRGLYHVSSEPLSKFRLLEMINEEFETGISIEPDASLRIDRSLDSGRFRSATGYTPPDWPTMIRQMREDAEGYDKWRR